MGHLDIGSRKKKKYSILVPNLRNNHQVRFSLIIFQDKAKRLNLIEQRLNKIIGLRWKI